MDETPPGIDPLLVPITARPGDAYCVHRVNVHQLICGDCIAARRQEALDAKMREILDRLADVLERQSALLETLLASTLVIEGPGG